MAPTQRELVAHLYRRAGFGTTAAELDAATARGFDTCVEELLAGLAPGSPAVTPRPPALTPMRYVKPHTDIWGQYIALVNWWVDTMVTTSAPLREKLVLLLSNQFPTGFSKVGSPAMMHTQNQIFRELGPGRFDDLVRAVSKDPAMLLWLDANSDVRQDPNENFARELMERFTMGIGHYTQKDVHEAARCFAGWALDWKTGKFTIASWAVDPGIKTVLGRTGHLDGDDVIDLVTHHPACAPFVTSRLWSWLAYPVTPKDPVVAELAPGLAKNLRLDSLVASMLRHPAFVSERALNGLVKQPLEYVAQVMKVLGLTSEKLHNRGALDWLLGNLGQSPFDPPNVGGWGDNQYWLSTSTAQFRLSVAGFLVSTAKPLVHELESMPHEQVIPFVQRLLGVESFSIPSLVAMEQQLSWPPNALVLALVSPEYVVN